MPREAAEGALPVTSRSYEGEEDLQQMRALLVEGRAQTDDWRYAHVGDLLWQFFVLACHLDPRRHIRLWHEDRRLVAYAMLGEDPSFDFQVLAGYEWVGIEAEAMAWADARLADLRGGGAGAWAGCLASGARQDNAERIAFLEEHGFRQSDEGSEVNMLCPLDGTLPGATPPAGCEVRAVAGGEESWARAAVQREVWRPWAVGNIGGDDYARLMRLPGYDRDLDVVAVAPGGIIAAYVNGWSDTANRIGDFGPLGARPAYRRQGLTRAVLLECLRRMRARGMNRVSVSTRVSNTPAIGLYESVGFRIVNRYIEYVRGGEQSA